MATPKPKMASVRISDSDIQKVVGFYHSDIISRIMPGKSDCYSMIVNGVKQRVQKRLLLSSLKEAYLAFKLEEPDVKVGFSSFASLRPRNIVIPGSSGTHSVCVCTFHQNVKLMIYSSGIGQLDLGSEGRNTYKEFLRVTMCDPPTEKCWLGACEECPGTDNLREKLENFFDTNEVQEIRFKQWIYVDRTNLEELITPVEDFIDVFLGKLTELKPHSFIATQQSLFFKNMRETLEPGVVLIGGDFAENYHFVVQDAAQAFHWSNDQVTLHPFMVYYRPSPHSEVVGLSIVMISDELQHDTKAVYTFQCKLLDYLKSLSITLNRIAYFSDGAVSQYKNKNNLANLTFHIDDFGIPADWHFFATSHGKGIN